MKKAFIILLSTIALFSVAQSKKTELVVFSQELIQQEIDVKVLFDSLNNGKVYPDSTRKAIGESIRLKMNEILRDKDSFYYPFDSLRFLGKIYSDDNKLRIYTWNCELSDLTQNYYGFVQTEKACYPLRQTRASYVPDAKKTISLNNWYGSLYYKAICIEKGDDAKYILLGWSGLNSRESFKVIEVLSFEDKKASLGAPIIELDNGDNMRMVFTYCKSLRMNIEYDAKKKQFVFDHLSPTGDIANPDCLGPDMSVDAIKKKGKRFVLKKDVDARNNR